MVEDYKNHHIAGAADFECSTGIYTPVTTVNWIDGEGRRALHILRTRSRYWTEADAINAALLEGRRFVDELVITRF
jgi:hypothetical protein